MKKQNTIYLGVGIVCVILVVAIMIFSNQEKKKDVIKIGFIGPLTGDLSNLGKNALIAAKLAESEINKGGGIDGKELVIIYEDGGCDGKMATAAANKLINVDRVPVIIGAICAAETMSIAAIAEENKTVVVSYATSAPALREAGDYIFRTAHNAQNLGIRAAGYLTEKGYLNVAVLSCTDVWCKGVSDAFRDSFSGQIVGSEFFEDGDTDLRTEIFKIKEKNPEAILFAARTKSTLAGMEQIQEEGLNVFLLGGDTWDDSKEKGQYPNAEYLVTRLNLSHEFISKLKSEGGDTTVGAPQAYDTVKIIASILEQTQNPEEIKEELYHMPLYNGVSGNIQFDEKGDIKKVDYNILKI